MTGNDSKAQFISYIIEKQKLENAIHKKNKSNNKNNTILILPHYIALNSARADTPILVKSNKIIIIATAIYCIFYIKNYLIFILIKLSKSYAKLVKQVLLYPSLKKEGKFSQDYLNKTCSRVTTLELVDGGLRTT